MSEIYLSVHTSDDCYFCYGTGRVQISCDGMTIGCRHCDGTGKQKVPGPSNPDLAKQLKELEEKHGSKE